MSKFYSEISKYYNDIFPISIDKLQLIKDIAPNPPKDILDAASGSGTYSIALSDEGYNLTSIDLDEEMIDRLRGRNKEIDSRVLNILDIEKLNKKFDLIFCIGNSLVHLDNDKEISQFLFSARSSLKENGKLLIQIINYDRILEKNIDFLPTIKGVDRDLEFIRKYEHLEDNHKINFRTILKVNGNILENNELLYPIKSGEMRKLLEKAGFFDIKFYGNFKKDEFLTMQSQPLVIVAGI